MPFFDWALAHGYSRELSSEHDQEAVDLADAANKAVEWGKEIRRLSGTKEDTSHWSLNIVPSAKDGGMATTPSLYLAEDVRPDEWDEETSSPAALI